MMFGAITALTLSLFWAVRFIPGGSHGVPGLLSIGSLVQTPPGPINFDTSTEKRCGFDVRAVMIREKAEMIKDRSRHIRIEVQRENRHQHQHKQVHKRERRRCRGRMTPTQPTLPIPPLAPVPAPGP